MELFHVLTRGVDGRKIFFDSRDYARFVHDLFEFNDTRPALEYSRSAQYVGRTTSHMRENIVHIHGWALMKNHFHLLLSERTDGGITLFLRKLSGYARYFNERHERKGILLQRSKKILIERPKHFLYILHYIHLNPLDYLKSAKGWRERDKGTVRDVQQALAYLKEYRWSSYLDYCGQHNFPSLLTRDLFEESDYRSSVREYLLDRAVHPAGMLDLTALE